MRRLRQRAGQAWSRVALACVLCLPAAPVPAQSALPQARAEGQAILTLDQERLFADSLWGRRATAAIEADSAALSAENRRIEAELTAEERSLTEERAGMDSAAFRAAADAFDARVTEIRRIQDEKARELGRRPESERQRFFAAALPALSAALRAQGALVILDSRAIFLAADSIDVTDELIAAVDEAIGAGSAREAEGAEPEPGPAPAPD